MSSSLSNEIESEKNAMHSRSNINFIKLLQEPRRTSWLFFPDAVGFQMVVTDEGLVVCTSIFIGSKTNASSLL